MLVVPHNSAMNLRQYICALALFVCAFAVQAHDFVTERAWVEDPTGQLTLAEVKQQPQTPLNGTIFTQGFSQSVFWFRIRITPDAAAPAKPDDKLIIRIRPPLQDQIWLYDPLAPQDQVKATGDYFDWMDDEYRSLNLNLVVPVGQRPRDIWLKLKTNQSTMTAIEVLTESEVRAIDRRQEMLTMLYIAVLVICFGWGVLTWINQRDSLVALYVWREFVAIVYALVILGYARVFNAGWLDGVQLDAVSNVCTWVFVAIVIWFDSCLLAEFKPNRWLLKLLTGLTLALPLEVVAVLLGKIHIAVLINAVVVPPALILALLCALSTRAWSDAAGAPEADKPLLPKWLLVSVYGALLITVLLNRLPVMGLMNAEESSFYTNLIYPILTSLTLMVLVQTRLYRLTKRQQESQRKLELAEIEALQERAQRVEQSNFLKMLAHEMKTPLSVVRMAVGSAKLAPATNSMIDRAITDMNSVIERLLEVERLQDRQISLSRTDFDLIALLHKTITALPGGEVRIKSLAPPVLLMNNDMRLVQVVLSNLLDNALKYSPPDAPVQVDVVADNEVIHITVENPIGTAGVPDPTHVFDKYYRAPRAYERTGSGLGLYLVQTLVAMMGGQVAYDSNDDKVVFSMTLPFGMQESF